MGTAFPLACPRDRGALHRESAALVCDQGHTYPVVDGTPILLVETDPPTHAACRVTPEQARLGDRSLTVPGGGARSARAVDATVQELVAATCGGLYRHLAGGLERYPIPDLPLPWGSGEAFLDIGCSWGRWTIAAARRGYRAVGVDPSLEAVAAAQRVADQLGVEATYVVADARRLPFPDRTFDVAFSYSVFQHFSKVEAVSSFDEIRRVLQPGGQAKIQMANAYGARSLWNQLRERRYREPRRLFDVRYWSPGELVDELSRRVGATSLEVDGFFTLNPQPADLDLLRRRDRLVVRASEALRRASDRLPPLRGVADSLYAVSRRSPTQDRPPEIS